MEKETELTTSAHLSDNDALLKALQARGGGLMFKLPQLTNVNNNNNNNNDDDDNDVSDMVSLKDWQPAPSSHTQQRSSVVREMSPMEAHLNGIQMKGSVRTRYIPLMEPKKPKEVHKEEVNNNKAPLHMVGAPAKLPSLEVVDEGINNNNSNNNNNGHHHHDHAEKEREEEQEEQSDNREPPLIQIHHQHSISLANGIAPEPARGGIAFDISLEDDGMSARSSSRGSSLRVSFVDDVNLGSPSPPRARAPSKSPTRARSGPQSHQQSHHQSHQQTHQSHPTTSGNRPKSNPMPPWESSTKVGPASAPLPKKYVQPTLHGIKVKKGQTTGIKNRLPQPVRNSMPSLEIENEYRSNSNGHHHVDKDGYGGWEHRSGQLVGRSLDSHYFGGGEYDSASKLISSNLISPVESTREEEPQSQPQPQPQSRKSSSRPFKTRSNGSHKSSDASSEEETNKITGDFGRLFSKLRRASAPLSKPPVSKSQSAAPLRTASAPVKQILRAQSAPSIVAKPVTVTKTASVDPSVGAQKYSIDSYASLKMLQECCSTEKLGTTPSYNVQKPRKIRDHEPHRHYYKTISKSIDQKLKS